HSNSHINVDDVKTFTTPRKLIHSLQVQDLQDFDSNFSTKQVKKFRSPTTRSAFYDQSHLCREMNRENGGGRLFSEEEHHGQSESVSSTGDEVVPKNKPRLEKVYCHISARSIIYSLFAVLLALLLCLLAIGNQDDQDNILVPT
ncbi:Unknown protein, partial [Striga hermonthica]